MLLLVGYLDSFHELLGGRDGGPSVPCGNYQGIAEVAPGVARRVGQRGEHLFVSAVVLADVVLDDGVPACEAAFIPGPLEDAFGSVALLLGDLATIIQDAVSDASIGVILSLSKGSDDAEDSFAGIQAALSRPVLCSPYPSAGQTPGMPPGCSCHPPSPPGEPTDMCPPSISIVSPWAGYDPVNGGERSGSPPPNLSDYPPARVTLLPPFVTAVNLRRSSTVQDIMS